MRRTACHSASRWALGALATVGAVLCSGVSLSAQVGTPPPNSYALTNVRIVTAPGRVIERGTIVVREGRIAAVGAQVVVPADVQRIDLNGHSVYPGLIDAASALGLPRAPAAAQGGRGGPPQGAPTQQAQALLAAGRAEIPEIQPTRLAAQVVQLRDADLEVMRAQGVTLVGLAFEPAIISGQTAVLSLVGTSVDSTVLRSPAALQIGLQTRRGGYPTTLMGTLAYLEQAFSDAAYQQRAQDAFDRDPARGPRPVRDADREALVPAAARRMAVLITAARENDLIRAIALAKRSNLDYTLVGVQEGYRATSLLAKEARPVVLSLQFPQPDGVTGRAFELHVAPLSGRDSAKASADSAVARQVRGNAAALVKAGVPIALSSFGLARPADFRERIRNVIDAGLSADDALRALTITPARVLGVERVAGTIEPGKLANLVVTEGDLFDRNGRIRHVFVEGRKFDIRDSGRQQAQPRPGNGGAQ
ncbi:MAG: amidohydrolase family protein [Longimicrobiales bacterium]